MRKIVSVLVFLLFVAWGVGAQQAVGSLARAQLQQRGVSEAEIRAKLVEKNIDIDAITPEELLSLQPIIEQALQEIEAEKVKKSSEKPKVEKSAPKGRNEDEKVTAESEVKQVAAKSSVEVKQRIKEGATIEEAVSEALLDGIVNENTPKSKIYGQDLFRNKSLEVFRTTKDARPPDSYILGVGDEVTVVIFGQSQGDFKYTINEDGYINPEGVGKIFLKGVAYGKARSLVRTRFSRAFAFRDDQFVASLTTARTITVNIFGEVVNYGSFTFSAINTAFNAIAATGGPTAIGSVRNIKITSNGKTKELDVYEFMNTPNLQYDFYLENNDVIHIPVAEKVVSIFGAVNRPSTYELKHEETLQNLLKFSGGLGANAYKNRVQVKRSVADRTVLIDVDLKQNPNFFLQNGDQVTVTTISAEVQNKVTVTGEVDFPGTYAVESNLDLAALVFKVQLKPTARKDLAFVLRKKLEGGTQIFQVNLDTIIRGGGQPFLMEPSDQLLIFRQDRFLDAFFVDIKGAVREPNQKTFSKGLKLSEYLLLSGGLREDATDFGYILRTNPSDRTRYYLKINPQKAIENPNGSENVLLQGLDEIKVLSKLDFRDSATIRVSGSVRSALVLPYGKALTLSDAIRLAGGLSLGAAKGKIDLFRVKFVEEANAKTLYQSLEVQDQLGNSGQDILLEPFDEIVVRAIPEFSLLTKVQISGAVKYPGEYALLNSNEKLSEVVKRAGGLSADAYPEGGKMMRKLDSIGVVVTRMEIALKNPRSAYNLTLKDGDEILIPKSLDLVTIRTLNTKAFEVFEEEQVLDGSKISVAFRAGKRGKWYINEYAGGALSRKNMRQLKVHYPNGHIKKTRSLGFFSITPKVHKGSKILLPELATKTKPKAKERKSIDWDKIFVQTLSVATATATMIIALKN
jgi:protein involved in polysaccharide export with SLBB domain